MPRSVHSLEVTFHTLSRELTPAVLSLRIQPCVLFLVNAFVVFGFVDIIGVKTGNVKSFFAVRCTTNNFIICYSLKR